MSHTLENADFEGRSIDVHVDSVEYKGLKLHIAFTIEGEVAVGRITEYAVMNHISGHSVCSTPNLNEAMAAYNAL